MHNHEGGSPLGGLGPGDERDACALLAYVSRSGKSSRHGVEQVLKALGTVGHRAGYTDGECDGAGILVDLPCALWADFLGEASRDASMAYDPRFHVAHLFSSPERVSEAIQRLRQTAAELGQDVLLIREALTRPEALGPRGRAEAPVLLQAGLWATAKPTRPTDEVFADLERDGFTVVSWSASQVVYKVRGDAPALGRFYTDLEDPRLTTAFVLGHLRFSTNTQSRFDRVQPFPSLGHNGEINTLARLRQLSFDLGISLSPGGSDSQDLCRLVRGLADRYGLTLFEIISLLFPPVPTELARLSPLERKVALEGRDRIGPIAQGPVALVARLEDEVVCSLDALGLRPLWLLESNDAYWVTSERAVLPFCDFIEDPRPLAPGEKLGFKLAAGQPPRLLADAELRAEASRRLADRDWATADRRPHGERPNVGGVPLAEYPESLPGLCGWDTEDADVVRLVADEGKDPITSLGYDGSLAALAEEPRQVADFLHETVAVVTNPAIDRQREGEHFSTEVLLGVRPPLPGEPHAAGPLTSIPGPFLLEPVPAPDLEVDGPALRAIAEQTGSALLDDLRLPHRVLSLTFRRGESLEERLDGLGVEAQEAVTQGAALLILDDGRAFQDGLATVDPLLGTAAVVRALRPPGSPSLRRRVGIVVRSAGLRRLHDLMAVLAVGADAADPYLLWREVVRRGDPAESLTRMATVLRQGAEKVISTLGIHELSGYVGSMSIIGLAPEVVGLLGLPAYFAEGSGHTFGRLEREALRRLEEAEKVAAGESKVPVVRFNHLRPKIWKAAGDATTGREKYNAYTEKLAALERQRPVALRHLLDFKRQESVSAGRADPSVGEHRYPLVVSSMSFGSQDEISYRGYLEGAVEAGILCLNGEGGELPDLVGKFPVSRGVEIASGRFGISASVLAATRYLEIKIGQGAKPGEGGHLPGKKVSDKVARARNVQPGVDLISPSNNHDLYSIEDLGQLIDELKEVSGGATVIVKMPVVPGIGTIAVGVVKAGADVVSFSGFDGGTGAARRHAIRHVGLPAEIGLFEVHRALSDAGLRDKAEIWVDGGMRSGTDVVKMVLLGANRVGFGTLSMVAVQRRSRQTDHVDTTAEAETAGESKEQSLKRFVPGNPDTAETSMGRLFISLGEEVAELTHALGFSRTQDMVGRADLLVQARGQDLLDLSPLLVSRSAPEIHLRPFVSAAERRLAAYATPEDEREPVRALPAGPNRRMVGTALAGAWVRQRETTAGQTLSTVTRLRLMESQVAGQGFAAFQNPHLDTVLYGGAQDGVAKGAIGGRVAILRGRTADGALRDGSVGKSFAYGAQGGKLFIQGDADSRACVRLSGGAVVFGARPHGRVDGSASRANLKGFAFEYMTGGTVVCLGDPGPWMAAGMTGGVVYLALWPDLGLTLEDLSRRVARDARCRIEPSLGADDVRTIGVLLAEYADLLDESTQTSEAKIVRDLARQADGRFVALWPEALQVSQDLTTE